MSDPAEPPLLPKLSPAWQGWACAVVIGAIGWALACHLSGRKEAWDSPAYFQLSYPLFALMAVMLGYFWPGHPWRWALGIALGQALVAFAKNPTANLLPLGLIVFAVYSAPLILPAMLGSRLHRWRRKV